MLVIQFFYWIRALWSHRFNNCHTNQKIDDYSYQLSSDRIWGYYFNCVIFAYKLCSSNSYITPHTQMQWNHLVTYVHIRNSLTWFYSFIEITPMYCDYIEFPVRTISRCNRFAYSSLVPLDGPTLKMCDPKFSLSLSFWWSFGPVPPTEIKIIWKTFIFRISNFIFFILDHSKHLLSKNFLLIWIHKNLHQKVPCRFQLKKYISLLVSKHLFKDFFLAGNNLIPKVTKKKWFWGFFASNLCVLFNPVILCYRVIKIAFFTNILLGSVNLNKK